jgi:hypothetical protein
MNQTLNAVVTATARLNDATAAFKAAPLPETRTVVVDAITALTESLSAFTASL